MEIPQIKDKITARAFALKMALGHRLFKENLEIDDIDRAKRYAEYLIGDTELPEIYQEPTTIPFNWTTEPIQPLTVRYRHESD